MYALKYSLFWGVGGVALVLLVVWGSLTPARDLGVVLPSDKLIHVFAYFTLMSWFGGLFRRPVLWRVALALCLLGLSIEALQELGGSRQGEVSDFVANSAGVALGLIPGLLIPGGWCSHAERILVR